MARVASKRSILLVTNDLGPHTGGIENFILGLLDQLDGKEVVIYTSNENGSEEFDKNLIAKTGVVIIRDNSKILLPTPFVTKRIMKVVKEYDCEIAWFGAAAPLALMAKRLKQVGVKRTIAITHGHEVWWSKLPVFKSLMRKIGNNCDVVTYLGEFTRTAISSALGKNPQLIHLAPGIAIEHFKPNRKQVDLIERFQLGSDPVIVSVGRLVKRKGQDKLVSALPLIKKEIPSAKLVFIGQGKLQRKLTRLVKKHDLGESVRFIGRVSYDDLPKYISLGDVFAMPSRSRNFGLEVEGLGIVYLEASASGLPVIAGDSGGAPDAVIVGETGYVVDGKSPTDIAKHICYLLKDKDLAKKLGENGRAWVEANWGWDLWGSRFKEILKG